MEHRYGYDDSEQIWMFLFSGITNFTFLPGIFLQLRKKRTFEAFVGFFTMFTSFMYHSVEALGIREFFLDVSKWHRLDNIGSILCIIGLIIHAMDNERNTDLVLYYAALFITLLAQERKPWDLDHTLYPIYIFVFVWLVVAISRRRFAVRDFNKVCFIKGTCCLILAVFFFSRGLDENRDYLRFNHGMWHFFMGFVGFYLWQIRSPKHEEKGLRDLFTFSFYDFNSHDRPEIPFQDESPYSNTLLPVKV